MTPLGPTKADPVMLPPGEPMSMRTGAAGRIVRTQVRLPGSTSFTVMGWLYIRSVRSSQWHYFFSLEGELVESSLYAVLGYNNFGTFEINSNGAGAPPRENFPSNPPLNRWIQAYLRCSGLANGDFSGGWRVAGEDVWITTSADFTSAWTPVVLNLGNTSWPDSEWVDGEIANVKVFDRALDDLEIDPEFSNFEPVRADECLHWLPMLPDGGVANLGKNHAPMGGPPWEVVGGVARFPGAGELVTLADDYRTRVEPLARAVEGAVGGLAAAVYAYHHNYHNLR